MISNKQKNHLEKLRVMNHKQRNINISNAHKKGKYFNCVICNRQFWRRPYLIKTGRIKFCSIKCMGIWESNNRNGNKNGNWRGGINDIRDKIRHDGKYKLWRQQIFIRDNFTCQECNIKGIKVEAHHKKSFSKLLQEIKTYLPLFNLYEGAMIYSPLWDIDNGVTLCMKCHNKTKKKEVIKSE